MTVVKGHWANLREGNIFLALVLLKTLPAYRCSYLTHPPPQKKTNKKSRFGIEGADNVVKSLRCIWISHIHADHHSGLARILSFRHNLLKGIPHEQLLVVGPTRIGRFLGLYEQLEELDMQFLDCLQTTGASWDAFERSVNPNMNQLLSNLNKVLQDAGLKRLASFPVEHCPKAFGVALTAAERINSVGKIIPGWKVVYSGDTRPCPELMEASRGATVLIHEVNH